MTIYARPGGRREREGGVGVRRLVGPELDEAVDADAAAPARAWEPAVGRATRANAANTRMVLPMGVLTACGSRGFSRAAV